MTDALCVRFCRASAVSGRCRDLATFCPGRRSHALRPGKPAPPELPVTPGRDTWTKRPGGARKTAPDRAHTSRLSRNIWNHKVTLALLRNVSGSHSSSACGGRLWSWPQSGRALWFFAPLAARIRPSNSVIRHGIWKRGPSAPDHVRPCFDLDQCAPEEVCVLERAHRTSGVRPGPASRPGGRVPARAAQQKGRKLCDRPSLFTPTTSRSLAPWSMRKSAAV